MFLDSYIESQALYDILERDVIPTFYERRDNYPHDWIKMMKNSIIMGGKQFSSHRMLREYTEKFYIPGIQAFDNLAESGFKMTRDVVVWNKSIINNWNKVSVSSVEMPDMNGSAHVGQTMLVKIKVYLGDLSPDDVKVELMSGSLNVRDEIVDSEVFPASLDNSNEDGSHIYHVDMVCTRSGRLGITARVMPHNTRHIIKEHPLLVTWLS